MTHPASHLVDAHDGMVLQAGGLYYQYGTAYGCGFTLTQPDSPWCGVRIYSSRDMMVWTDQGMAFDPSGVWQQRCGQGKLGCFRPHVVRRADGQYVMWINSYDTQSGYWILVASNPLGPWQAVGQPRLGISLELLFTHGDEDVVVSREGIGYVVYTLIGRENNLHDLVVEELASSLTTGTGKVVRLGLHLVEAPSLFERNDVWYLLYSDPACPYCTTGTSYATSSTPLGPWVLRGSVSSDSCRGQPAAVKDVTVDGQRRWLWQVDQWVPRSLVQSAAATYLAPLQFADRNSLPIQPCLIVW